MLFSLLPLVAVVAFILIVKYRLKLLRKQSLPLPPGPKGWPLIGNLFDFPTTNQAKIFRDQYAQHGDLTHFIVLGQHIVALNSLQAAKDLLDKRSAIYSDRPAFIMNELVGFSEWSEPVMRYGPQWRAHRRVLHQSLLPGPLARYDAARLRMTRDFLRRLLESPEAFLKHCETSFAATALRVAYGIELAPAEEARYVRLFRDFLDVGTRISVAGRYLVEVAPVLRHVPAWFPGAQFKREAAAVRARLSGTVGLLYKQGKETTDGKDSIVSSELSRNAHLDDAGAAEAEEVAAGVAATVYLAGAETTESSLHAFFLAMALHPEVQEKAWAELDSAVGRDRLPEFSDREALPYVSAIARELVRWHVVAPTGLAHQNIQDDEYKGYTIPRGTVLVPNLWSYSRDSLVYPDPERFLPERYMREGKLALDDEHDPYGWVFGFGRRICPGRHLADSALFIMCSSILHTFKITPLGPLEARFTTNALTSHPKDFRCEIKPRFDGAEALVLSTSS